jgi:large subunit ribosomal protein L4
MTVKVPCYSATGDRLDDIEVDESLFGEKVLAETTHQMVVAYALHKRTGTHATKTRGMLAYGGRKPWRQKGTGRARAGTRRSPIWRGGGTIFGPQPRQYNKKTPKKMRHAALNSALLSKFQDGEVVIVDGLKVDEPKTKPMAELFGKIEEIGGKSCLLGHARVQPQPLSVDAQHSKGAGRRGAQP